MRHGGKILVEQLAAHGTGTVFMVPGESFLAALDGLFDSTITTVVCRHEGGAAMMAEADAKLSGRPGVVFVTRGPGAANATSGLYVAQQDETPLVLFVGLPPARLEGQRPFQDIDLAALYSGIAKWTAIVRRTSDLPAMVARAFQIASSGRPGPVVLGLPQDVIDQSSDVPVVEPAEAVEAAPSSEVMSALETRLAAAQCPFMIVGGPGWNARIKRQVEAFALRFDLPVATSFRCQDYFDNRHPSYAGHLGFGLDKKLASGLRIADVLIVLGAPLGEVSTAGHTLIETPVPRQSLVQVHPSADEIGILHKTGIGIASSTAAFAEALRSIEPALSKPWGALRRDLRGAYEVSRKNTQPAENAPAPGTVDLGHVVRALSDLLPDDAIVTNGAGNYAQFVHRYFVYKTYRTCLAPASGSMGYGLPAAIAAKLKHPERTVVCFAGDGCLMMTLPELATAVQYGLNIIVIVANNGMLGTIRMHQEQTYPGRVIATSLVNPNFVTMARSFGASGERVEHAGDFVPAFERAKKASGPAIIELVLDPQIIAPGKTISQISTKY